ncbi:MAG TPA: DNA methyltransferase [Bryobacteraceae bacterium]
MCASILEFGFKIPCLVRSNGELIDGHPRLKAARSLGLKEISVILCDEWTAAQVKAFRLLVNRSVTWADFDQELLARTSPPVELMRRPILNHLRRGELVYDPFPGGGTTLVAAELTKRVCCGMELDPRCVDVIVRRWQVLTGKQATLEGTGGPGLKPRLQAEACSTRRGYRWRGLNRESTWRSWKSCVLCNAPTKRSPPTFG